MPQKPRINFDFVYDAIGLDPTFRTAEHAVDVVLPMLESVFSELELKFVREQPESNAHLRELYGERELHTGSAARALKALSASSDPVVRDSMEALMRNTGRMLAIKATQGLQRLSDSRSVIVNADSRTVLVDGEPASFDTGDAGAPLVVEYGPGLKGRLHIQQQINRFVTEGSTGFAYLPISNGPFINEFLTEWVRQELGRHYDEQQSSADFQWIVGRTFIPREDGMARTTNAIINGQRENNAPVQVADLVIASGVHLADPAELKTGIANAYEFLKPGGVLVLRAPKHRDADTPNAVTGEEMIGMAHRAGFRTNRTTARTISTGNDLSSIEGIAATLRR